MIKRVISAIISIICIGLLYLAAQYARSHNAEISRSIAVWRVDRHLQSSLITHAKTNNKYLSCGQNNYKAFINNTDETSEAYTRILQGLEYIPAPVAQAFYEDGGYLLFVDDECFEELRSNKNFLSLGSTGSANAYYLENPSTGGAAYIALNMDKVNLDIPSYYIICHEFGHYLDSQLGDISLSDEFREYMEEEAADSFFGANNLDGEEYYSSNPREYFANMFATYCIRSGNSQHPIALNDCDKCSMSIKYVERALSYFIGEGDGTVL